MNLPMRGREGGREGGEEEGGSEEWGGKAVFRDAS